MRHVICHYHIYKNAGTSFDHILGHTFGSRHLSFDGPFPFFTIDQEQLDRIIARKREAVAFSSHQIQLPPPASPDYRVHAILFLRHPILRIASIWRFKRAHPDGTATAEAAARLSFADWVRHSLDDPQEVTHVSNAQTRLVSARPRSRPAMRRTAWGVTYDLDLALANLDAVAVIGRTEHFAADARTIATRLAPFGLALTLPADLHRNATEVSCRAPADRVAETLDALGPQLADALLAANAQDLALRALADRRAAAPADAGVAA